MENNNPIREYFINNIALFVGILLVLIIFAIARTPYFNPCCEETSTCPECPNCPGNGGSDNCVPDDTKIIISLEDLSISCSNEQDCFIAYENKFDIIAHPDAYGTLASQRLEDPAFIGYKVCDGPNPGWNCNEPPDAFNNSPLPDPKGDHVFVSLRNINSSLRANILDIEEDSDILLEYNTCSDKAGDPKDGKFLNICLLDVGETFETLFLKYTDIVNCDRDFLLCTQPQIIQTCPDDAMVLEDWINDNSIKRFTVWVQHGLDNYYITILKTDEENKVFRIAYSNPAYLSGKFIFN